ncbi:hypothetical protein Q3G72_017650 [Acer saccharum]|nr:hypothetical protein Q3G72_017650 [Acer saccharum]
MRYFRPLPLFRSVGKYKLCLLGTDTGEKYTRLTITDWILLSSSPLKTCVMGREPNTAEVGLLFGNLIQNEEVGGLLVGFSAAGHHIQKPEHDRQAIMCEEDHRGPEGIKPRKNHAGNPTREYLHRKEAVGTGEHKATEKTKEFKPPSWLERTRGPSRMNPREYLHGKEAARQKE